MSACLLTQSPSLKNLFALTLLPPLITSILGFGLCISSTQESQPQATSTTTTTAATVPAVCPTAGTAAEKIVTVLAPKPIFPDGARLQKVQRQTLRLAQRIGKATGMGTRLAAVAYQESSLGLYVNSPGHFGVGSVGHAALRVVLRQHSWLKTYFVGANWAQELRQDPSVSLWVSAYYLLHCYHKAGDEWMAAYSLYRYGSVVPGAPYPQRIRHNRQIIRRILAA